MTTKQTKESNTKDSFIFASSPWEECKIIFSMMIPIIIQSIFQFLPSTISFTFIGHLTNSTKLLAGAGLARIYTNVTASSFAYGITTGLQTLIPQAIGNNKQDIEITNEMIENIQFRYMFVGSFGYTRCD